MRHLKDEDLAPALSAELGQELRVAVYARFDTRLSPTRMLTPLGNYLIARPAAARAAQRVTERTDVPLDAAMILGITADALHVWRADPMLNRVGEHVGQVSLDRVTDIAVTPGRSWQQVTIVLAEGEKIEVEGRGAAHALVAAYRERHAGWPYGMLVRVLETPPRVDEHAWERGVIVREAYYGVVLAGSVTAVWATGTGTGRILSITALCAFVPWYCLVGRRARRGGPVPARTVCYQLGVLALLVTAQLATLTSSVLLFALVPQTFMLLPTGWGMLALALFNVVPVAEALSAPSPGAVEVTVGVTLCVAFAGQYGWWIQRIIRQSRERADLIAQLVATRAELAESERQAGILAERQRLAVEIHDTLAQGFTSILMLLKAAESAPPEQAGKHRERAARAAQENLIEARALISAQPPTELTDSSLPNALRRLADRLGEETGVTTSWQLTGEPRGLHASTEVIVLRCAQEGLTNVRRHAKAARATLRLRYLPGGVRLEVSDDGAGFTPTAAAGFGLAGMRERVTQAGGHLAIRSTPGSGTVLTVEVPA